MLSKEIWPFGHHNESTAVIETAELLIPGYCAKRKFILLGNLWSGGEKYTVLVSTDFNYTFKPVLFGPSVIKANYLQPCWLL